MHDIQDDELQGIAVHLTLLIRGLRTSSIAKELIKDNWLELIDDAATSLEICHNILEDFLPNWTEKFNKELKEYKH